MVLQKCTGKCGLEKEVNTKNFELHKNGQIRVKECRLCVNEKRRSKLKINKNEDTTIYRDFKLRRFIERYSESANLNKIFTVDELKVHIESLFKPWMNWDNWKRFDGKNHVENDVSTWVWNIGIINNDITSLEYLQIINLFPGFAKNIMAKKHRAKDPQCARCGLENPRRGNRKICSICEAKEGKDGAKEQRNNLKNFRGSDLLDRLLYIAAQETSICSSKCGKKHQLTEQNFRLKRLNIEPGKERLYWASECKNCEQEYSDTIIVDPEKSKLAAKNRLEKFKKKLEDDPYFALEYFAKAEIKICLADLVRGRSYKGYIESELFVPYTSEELREYIKSLWEPWMNWDNYGPYRKDTWKDDDQSTWKWQVDHIIPRANFTYSSINDEQFKRCWALSNLRPYSSKQNCLDGVSRIRHKKE